MDINKATAELENGTIKEAVIEPSPNSSGWRIVLHQNDGTHDILTDHSGIEKRYLTLDHATETLKTYGFSSIRIEESF